MNDHPNVTRVRQALAALGADVQVVQFPSGTRTALEAAAAVGVSVAQIAKSLVFLAGAAADAVPSAGGSAAGGEADAAGAQPGDAGQERGEEHRAGGVRGDHGVHKEPGNHGVDGVYGVLVITSGANRVAEAKVARLVGRPLRRADADAVKRLTGYPVGGVPPVAHATALRVFVDRDLLRHDRVWAAGGTPHTVFPISPAELVRITGGAVADVRDEGYSPPH